MDRRILTLAASVAIALTGSAKVKLPHLISDGMVIQQNSEVRLWGWAEPGHEVTVSPSWEGQGPVSAKADGEGRWNVSVKSPAASFTPLSITFSEAAAPGRGRKPSKRVADEVTVSDVLAGEVWVCAGQSNMEMPVKGFGNCPVENYNLEVINAADGIRSVKIPSVMSMQPLDDAPCQWRASSPQTIPGFSATGYFFAKTMRRALNIPIGLIEANKGGSRVESWLDRDYLSSHTDEPLDSNAMVRKYSWDYHRPLLWGNGTFHPILNYTIRGILYYQGCSNVGDPAGRYTQRLSDLAAQWRRDFRQGDVPFYFVQIAPYYYDDANADWGARLREQQWNATKVIPNSAMVCTNDCVYPYETQQIHPAQKQKVGQRLAFLALNKTYGMKQIICDSPTFKSMDIKGDTVFVQLDHLADGINRYEDIQGFEMCGADRVYHKANAYYYWTKGIILTCPEVKQPVNIRYCFRNFQVGNVANQGGLPLVPFRTDDY